MDGHDPATSVVVDREKLGALVEAVKSLLIANSCSCDVESVDDMPQGLTGDNRCMEHRLEDALAAFEKGGAE